MATKKNIKKKNIKKKPVAKKKSTVSLNTKKKPVKKSTAVKKAIVKKTSTTKKAIKKPIVDTPIKKPTSITKKTIKKPIIETPIEKTTILPSKKQKIISAFNEYRPLFFMLIGLGILIIILIIVLIINNKDNYKKNLYTYKEQKKIVPEDIKNVYELFTDVNCSGDYKWSFDETDTLSVKDLDNNVIIDLTFKELEKNNLIDDSITKEEFINAQNALFSELDKNITFDEYSYAGYDYVLKKDKITRNYNICLKQTEYISSLDSYEIKDDKLYLYVYIGYINDGSLYNVEDKLVKTYYDPSEKSELLKESTKYKYTFDIIDNIYYFKNVEKIV